MINTLILPIQSLSTEMAQTIERLNNSDPLCNYGKDIRNAYFVLFLYLWVDYIAD